VVPVKEYKTIEIARLIGIHPNTVRLYEDIEFISKPDRKPNGYRVFTDVHLEQIKLVRLALRGEVLQNGLRKEAIKIIKTSALGDYNAAIENTECYLAHLRQEYLNAEEALASVGALTNGEQAVGTFSFTRKEAADYLGVTIDSIRNWELNGLVSIPRRDNGFRIYTEKEIRILKIIRTLRCTNYSLMSILRMLNSFYTDDSTDLADQHRRLRGREQPDHRPGDPDARADFEVPAPGGLRARAAGGMRAGTASTSPPGGHAGGWSGGGSWATGAAGVCEEVKEPKRD
jgi:DNA-binding transcriptional MerR regulator